MMDAIFLVVHAQSFRCSDNRLEIGFFGVTFQISIYSSDQIIFVHQWYFAVRLSYETRHRNELCTS